MSGYALPLPYYADTRGAYQIPVPVPNPGNQKPVVYTVGGGYIEDPLTVSATVITDATVATRVFGLTLADADGNLVWQINQSVTLSAGSSANLLFTKNAPNSYGVSGGVLVTTIPIGLAYPGYRISIVVGNFAAGDALTGAVFGMVRIPTGGIDPNEGAPAAYQTPLLV